MNIFDLAAGGTWALSEADLLSIMMIAARAGEGPEAVALKLGRPLDNTRAVTMHGQVAVVPLEGPMFRRANMFTEISGGTSTEQFARDFRAAIENPSVAAVLLDISSPGGEAAGVNEVANAIRAARGSKPIVAYVDHMAASGAYWIASAADRIVVDATAMVGSIGVVTRYVKQADKPGVSSTEIVSSQSPRKHLDPMTDAGRSDIQRQVDAMAQVFVEAVARNRGTDAATVLERFGQGSVEVGAGAVALGMADAVGSFESVLAEMSADRNSPGGVRPPQQRSAIMANEPTTVETLTAASVAEKHPAIAEALRAEGRAAAEAATATAVASALEGDRARIVKIQELTASRKYSAAQCSEAIKTGLSPGEFALSEPAAAPASKHLAALAADETALAGKLPADAAPAKAAPDASLPLHERIKAEWDAKPETRAEFSDNFQRYAAYRTAEDAGQIRRISSKEA